MTEEERVVVENVFPFSRILVNRQGEIFDLNDQAKEIFLIGSTDLTNVHFRDYLSPKNWASFNNFLDGVFQSRTRKLLDVKLEKTNPGFATDVCIFGHYMPFMDLCQLTLLDISDSNHVPRVVDENIGLTKYNMLDRTSWRSKKHGQIFGYPDSSHEWTSELFMEFVVPEDRSRVGAALRESMSNGKDSNMEFRIRRKDGSIRWLWTIFYVLRNEDGVPMIMEGITQDVTEIRQNQIDLLNAEERYYSLIADLEIGVVMHGPDGRITVANPSSLRLLGLTMDQILCKTSLDPSWNVIHEDGSSYPGETHPGYITLQTGKPIKGAIMGVHRPLTNDRVWISVDSSASFDADGHVKTVTTIFKDVTSLLAKSKN